MSSRELDSYRSGHPAQLADVLERVLDKGIVIAGDIKIELLDIELLTVKIRLLIASADKAREMGINFIGSCCGSVAEHVREMARALGKVSKTEREWKSKTSKPMSAYEYYGHDKA